MIELLGKAALGAVIIAALITLRWVHVRTETRRYKEGRYDRD